MLKSKWLKVLGLMVSVVLLLSVSVFAAGTGKIAGSISDAKTGEALPGINVVLENTYLGAATDVDGFYMIVNVPAGTYTLKITAIGYSPYIVKNVEVLPDQTTIINATLEEEVVKGKEIVVKAERPIIQKDVSAATQVIGEEEIQNLSVSGAANVAQLSAGTVTGSNGQGGGNALRIRGGRGNDVAYMVDGFETTNIATGASGAAVASNAISQVVVITGGFNAEYGNAMSGVINVITKDARDKFTGAVSFSTDAISDKSYGENNVEVSIGGPIIKKKLNFFVAGTYYTTDDRAPSYGWDWKGDYKIPHHDLTRQRASFKLKFQPFEAGKFKIGLTYSNSEYRSFDTFYRYDLDYYYRTIDKSYTGYLSYTHTFNSNIFLESAVNYFMQETYFAPDKVLEALGDEFPDPSEDRFYTDGKFDVWKYGEVFTDTTLEYYANKTGVWTGDSLNGPDGRYDPSLYGVETRTFSGIFFTPGASARAYRHRITDYVGFKSDMTAQIGKHHEIKTGINVKRYTLKYVDITDPWTAAPNIPFYDYYWKDPYNPLTLAYYIQDKMEYEGMIVNLGVRIDYFDMNADKFKDRRYIMSNADGSEVYYDEHGNLKPEYYDKVYEKAEAKIAVSPRLGISFPVTDDTKFRLNYGYFYQAPELTRVFEGFTNAIQYIYSRGSNAIIGDPGLDFQKTIQYEIGLDKSFGQTVGMSVTLYSKKTVNLLNTLRVRAPIVSNSYTMYENSDIASVRGMEIAIEKRREGYFSGRLSYTLQKATGTSSYERGNYYDYLTNSTAPQDEFGNPILPKREFPLNYDRTHTFNAVLDFRMDEGEGPEIGGIKPFENFGINMIFRLASGFPYTPTEVYQSLRPGADGKAIGDVNSLRMPWTFRIDTKINKKFSVSMFNFNIYLSVLNLLNRENITGIYTATGQPDTDGFIETHPDYFAGNEVAKERYREALMTPDHYGSPRLINFGVDISW